MTIPSSLALAVLLLGAGWAVWDVTRTEQQTLVVYTTPALRDLLEKDLVPLFQDQTGVRVAPIYVAAGQQYNRLRMSGQDPEADLLLHASPLYLEKGFDEGRVEPLLLEEDASLDASLKGRDLGGVRAWHAFAWSPLVEVYPAREAAAPDLATSEAGFGFPHPLLSNNGIYVVLYLEHVDDAVGERLLRQTRVQPTNARANIGGVADGSFGLTLGYEAVVRFYQEQGAGVAYDVPVVDGDRLTTRVLFSAALIHGERHPAAEPFLRFLFTPEAQDRLAKHHFRPVLPDARQPEGTLDLAGVETFEQDWSEWRSLEAALSRYQVKA